MKVFQIQIVLLLGFTVVFSTPIVEKSDENVEELISENEKEIRPVDDDKLIDEIKLEIKVAEARNSGLDVAEISNENTGNQLIQETIIDEEKGVPYADREVETQKPEMSEEMKERIYGIEVDLCKNYDNPKSPLHLSHPTNCAKFYKCGNGRAFLQDCSLFTHFSVNLNRCDYVAAAKCKADGNYHFKLRRAKPVQASAIIEEEDPRSNEKPETGDFEIDHRCDGSDPFKPLHFKHPHDCSKFYKCYMGRAYVVKCPRSQNWSQNMNRCEHVSIAKCNVLKPSIRAAQLFVEEAESDEDDFDYDYAGFKYYDISNIMLDIDYKIEDVRCTETPKDRFHPVQFPHPSDCSIFYKCSEGFGYKVRCPATLFYNYKTEECDYPEKVRCTIAQPAQANVVQANTRELRIPQCTMAGEKRFAVDDSFTSYFECDGGVPYLRQCDDHELFNPILKICEHVTISDADLMKQLVQLDHNSHQVPQQIPVPQQPQYVPNYPQPQFQYPNVLINPNYQNAYPNMMNPNFYPNYMPQDWNNVYNTRDNMMNNHQYPGLNYPIQFQQSDSEVSSDNEEKDSREFNFDLGEVNENCPKTDDLLNPVHLSHQSDCKMFYKCFEERAFLFECPQLQEWSEELQRCDFHENANCNPLELLK